MWNLRAREAAFALLNPTHPVLRAASVFWPAQPARISTVRQRVGRIGVLMRHAAEHDLPLHLGRWAAEDWTDFLAGLPVRGVTSERTVTCYRTMLRTLYELRDVLTDGGPTTDPSAVPRRRHSRIGTDPVTVTTRPVLPATWWPLLRAAWTYIDVLAPDILAARDALARHLAPPPAEVKPKPVRRIDQELEDWLADPTHRIPVHQSDYRGDMAGTPMWSAISLAVTGGRSDAALDGSRASAVRRRQRVLEVAAQGRTQAIMAGQGTRMLGTARRPAGSHPSREPGALMAMFEAWLADPRNLIPVAQEAADEPVVLWQSLSRLVYGPHTTSGFTNETRPGRLRRAAAMTAVQAGRYRITDGNAGYRDLPIDDAHFAHVPRPDGTSGPWRTSITPQQLGAELRALQAACYVFTTALSMMRDSEIQELQRGALTEHFGSPALRSLKHKAENTAREEKWWITEPVAQVLAILEQLSWHPSHLFATVAVPALTNTPPRGRIGIAADDAIDAFIAHINAHRDQTGLTKIPAAPIRPHQLRKTMSVITAQQPDGEIALGIQLKHAARRALANRTTHGYGQPDATWAKEFDNQLEWAAAGQLAALLHDRAGGNAVAVGPGAGRLHYGLDHVLDALSPHGGLQAHHADQRTVRALLREEFTDLRLGTLNHCLWQPETAECQSGLSDDQRGQAPLIGACQPARCRNSTITATHTPIWIAEEHDLIATLNDRCLAPARREAVLTRLADVQRITHALNPQEDSP
ncbi:hypothetical protein ABT010_40605 [Streptomyces sp. NPDC002668]|uniref:hypothetical protein n=1 Tax=Streptomyces sp. NPDC002668 TaxID=3154422 RepID=UPI0033237716